MRTLLSIIKTVTGLTVFLLLLGFAVKNADPVTIRYFLGMEWQAPLAFVLLVTFGLGIFGGMLMLLLTRNDISFTASIGFIALIGIEIKNSILLVDFTNQLREEGVPLDEAIEHCLGQRSPDEGNLKQFASAA